MSDTLLLYEVPEAEKDFGPVLPEHPRGPGEIYGFQLHAAPELSTRPLVMAAAHSKRSLFAANGWFTSDRLLVRVDPTGKTCIPLGYEGDLRWPIFNYFDGWHRVYLIQIVLVPDPTCPRWTCFSPIPIVPHKADIPIHVSSLSLTVSRTFTFSHAVRLFLSHSLPLSISFSPCV